MKLHTIALSAMAALGIFLPSLAQCESSCCKHELAATAPLPDNSLYQVTSSWTNDAGAPVTLASLGGRPQIVTMFFANCEFACPILVLDMKRIEAALPPDIRDKVDFVLVSFDSKRDTPEALAGYRKAHGLNAHWTLLRGGPDDVQELAALLGVKYKQDARGQFAHSNVITLLNGKGEVVRQQMGLNQPGTDIIAVVRDLLSKTQPAKSETISGSEISIKAAR